jgi:uncharacterized membrane protein
MALATVWPRSARDHATDAVRRACQLGRERTLEADIAFGLQQLVDIAVKALSPGVNDPTTARICIDRLGELIGRVVSRRSPVAHHTEEGSRVTVVFQPPSVDDLVDIAFAEIRHYGASDPIVMSHLVEILGRLHRLALPAHRSALSVQALLALTAARLAIQLPADRSRVEVAANWLNEASPMPPAG